MGELRGDYFIEENPELADKLALLGAGVEEGGGVKLPLVEAAYFEEKGVISSGKSAGELVKLAKEKDGLAEERFIVLRHLRERGHIVRWGLGETGLMRIYRKGIRVGQDRTEMVLKVLREGSKPEISKDLESAGRMRKALIYAFVGGKGGILFVKAYRIAFD